MSNKTHVNDLLPAFALGSLDEDERQLVEAHLAVCASCREVLAGYEAVVDQLALAVPDVEPAAELKLRLMAGAQPNPEVPASLPRRRLAPRRFGWAWGAASLFLIAVLSISTLLLWQRLDRSQAETLLAIPLAGDAIVEGASGMLIISRDGQNGALVVDSLPTLDADHAYQLWLIRDDHRASGAIFTVDEGGYGGTRVEAPELLFEYSAAGVTIEPAGGSSGPTGERVLFGEFPD